MLLPISHCFSKFQDPTVQGKQMRHHWDAICEEVCLHLHSSELFCIAVPCLNWSLTLGNTAGTCALITSGLCIHFGLLTPKIKDVYSQSDFPFQVDYIFQIITFNPLWGWFLSLHMYFNTSFPPQRHMISSAIVIWHYVIPARNTDRTAGFFLPLCLFLLA